MSGLDDLLATMHRMRIVSARWSPDGLTLRAEVDQEDERHSSWRLRFADVLDYTLEDVSNCGLNVWHNDHRAIQQYTDPHEELYFAAPPRNADEAVGALWSAHVRLVDDWIPFDRYLRGFAALLQAGNGLVAKGPSFLIDAYARVLDEQGCVTSRLKSRRQTAVRHAVLAHFGNSYVVAGSIKASHL